MTHRWPLKGRRCDPLALWGKSRAKHVLDHAWSRRSTRGPEVKTWYAVHACTRGQQLWCEPDCGDGRDVLSGCSRSLIEVSTKHPHNEMMKRLHNTPISARQMAGEAFADATDKFYNALAYSGAQDQPITMLQAHGPPSKKNVYSAPS